MCTARALTVSGGGGGGVLVHPRRILFWGKKIEGKNLETPWKIGDTPKKLETPTPPPKN